jgi:hypothetical protein
MNDNHRYYTRSKDDLNMVTTPQPNLNSGTLSTGRPIGIGGGLQSKNLLILDSYQSTTTMPFGNTMNRPTTPVGGGFQFNTYSILNGNNNTTNMGNTGNIGNTNQPTNQYNEQAQLWEVFLKEGSGSVTFDTKMKNNTIEEKNSLNHDCKVNLHTFINLLGDHVSLEEIRYLDKRLGHQKLISVEPYLYPTGPISSQGYNNNQPTINNTMNTGMSNGYTGYGGSNNLTTGGLQNRLSAINNGLTGGTNVVNPLTPNLQNRFAGGLYGGHNTLNTTGSTMNQTSNNISLPFPQVGNGMIQNNTIQQPNLGLQNNLSLSNGLNPIRSPFNVPNNTIQGGVGIQTNTMQTNTHQGGMIQSPFTLQPQLNTLQTGNNLIGGYGGNTTGTNQFQPKLNSPSFGQLGSLGSNTIGGLQNNISSLGNNSLYNNGMIGNTNNQLNNNTTNLLLNRTGTTNPLSHGLTTNVNNNTGMVLNNNLQNNNILTSNTLKPLGSPTGVGYNVNPLQSLGNNQFGTGMPLLSNNFQNQPFLQTNQYGGVGIGQSIGINTSLTSGLNSLSVRPMELKHTNILGFNPDTLKNPKSLNILSYNTNINPQPQMSLLDKTSIGNRPTTNFITGNNNITFNSNNLQSSLQEKNISQIISQTSKDPLGITQRCEAMMKSIEDSKPKDMNLLRSPGEKSYLNSFRPVSSSVSFGGSSGVVFKSSMKPPLKDSTNGVNNQNRTYIKPTQLSVIKETGGSGKKSSYTEVSGGKFGSDIFRMKVQKEELKGFGESMLKIKPKKKGLIEPILETTVKKDGVAGIIPLKVNIPDRDIKFTIEMNKKNTGAALRQAIQEELMRVKQLEVDLDDIIMLSKEKPLSNKDILEDDLFIRDGITVFIDRRPIDKPSAFADDLSEITCLYFDIYPTTNKYCTKPSMMDIHRMKPEELRQIEDFTVYNVHGEIKFLGFTDVTGLDLDNIIILEEKCFSVYHNQPVPELGCKLNKRAEVRLNNIVEEDVDYTSGEYIARVQAFKQTLEAIGNAKLQIFDWAENYIIIEVDSFNRNSNN